MKSRVADVGSKRRFEKWTKAGAESYKGWW